MDFFVTPQGVSKGLSSLTEVYIGVVERGDCRYLYNVIYIHIYIYIPVPWSSWVMVETSPPMVLGNAET